MGDETVSSGLERPDLPRSGTVTRANPCPCGHDSVPVSRARESAVFWWHHLTSHEQPGSSLEQPAPLPSRCRLGLRSSRGRETALARVMGRDVQV